MDVLFSTLAGLGLRIFLGSPDGALALGQFSLTIIGLWEGLVLYHFSTRVKNSETDYYLALALRILVDLLYTGSIHRAFITLAWTGVGVVVAEIICAIPPSKATRVRRRSLPSHVRLYHPATSPESPTTDGFPATQPQATSTPLGRPSSAASSSVKGQPEIISSPLNPHVSTSFSKRVSPSLPSSSLPTSPTSTTTHNDVIDTRLHSASIPTENTSPAFLRPHQSPAASMPTSPTPSKSPSRANRPPSEEDQDDDLYFPSKDPLLVPAPSTHAKSSSLRPMSASDSDELRTPNAGNLELSDHDELKTPDNATGELSPLFSDNSALPTFASVMETLPKPTSFP